MSDNDYLSEIDKAISELDKVKNNLIQANQIIKRQKVLIFTGYLFGLIFVICFSLTNSPLSFLLSIPSLISVAIFVTDTFTISYLLYQNEKIFKMLDDYGDSDQ